MLKSSGFVCLFVFENGIKLKIILEIIPPVKPYLSLVAFARRRNLQSIEFKACKSGPHLGFALNAF